MAIAAALLLIGIALSRPALQRSRRESLAAGVAVGGASVLLLGLGLIA